MKNLFLAFCSAAILQSCQKEAPKSAFSTDKPLPPGRPEPQQPKVAANPAAVALNVETIAEGADIGKVIFTQNGQPLISFNNDAQTGKIKINGKIHTLSKLAFTDNNYLLSGGDVTVTAADGEFAEMVSDCRYGDFPTVTVKLGDKETVLNNIKVQDCPNYN